MLVGEEHLRLHLELEPGAVLVHYGMSMAQPSTPVVRGSHATPVVRARALRYACAVRVVMTSRIRFCTAPRGPRAACGLVLATVAFVVSGCTSGDGPAGMASASPPPDSAAPGASAVPATSEEPSAPVPSAAPSVRPGDYVAPDASSVAAGAPLAKETAEELLALVVRPEPTDGKGRFREGFLARTIAPGGPGHMNQGNPAFAHHAVSRRACLEGLAGTVLQTAEQRRICQGHALMVPIFRDGKPETAKACIDVFEFPDQPCELPFVWSSATEAKKVCEAQGKRLCSQAEWVDACSLDPEGGERSAYSYGDRLDLSVCNTHKSAARWNGEGTGADGLPEKPKKCVPDSVKTAWKSCSTNTEPSGAFPRCRSRLGVFDMQGNLAEAMTRYDPEEQHLVSQLKGSAFFYVDVHVKDGEPHDKGRYVDRCNHDPRWHVENMKQAWHVNYHLGFRCCLGLR